MLTPSQIQKLILQYHVADYENPIAPEILKAVASRVMPNDKNDHLMLPPEVEEAGPYEVPLPRSHVSRYLLSCLVECSSYQTINFRGHLKNNIRFNSHTLSSSQFTRTLI
ncbi:hypothetical protein Pst134EA_031873 [Puccinia striiformis f. sp. tritici]|uniref:uncharacterized protein n=1 Tax=Puccinia striiformis f. sp. tritici TaxID=168172 RepID=UPI002007BFE5|nr:uncharacterized protein Pst134EA_031873 [Puccinia striiformis f. sp. tritici]KAH9445148.1 hypothetical protein Pst134EA_031873 [Puccinia striiformis f. sp. tritici]